jgi:hypothetical protein
MDFALTKEKQIGGMLKILKPSQFLILVSTCITGNKGDAKKSWDSPFHP